MTILWNKKLIKLSDGSYIAWGLKRKKFFFANRNELKLNCSLIEYYEQREKCDKKVISDYRKINAELKKELEIIKELLFTSNELDENTRSKAEQFLKECE